MIDHINLYIKKILENYVEVLETKDFTKIIDEEKLLFHLNSMKKSYKMMAMHENLKLDNEYINWLDSHAKAVRKKDFTGLDRENDVETFRCLVKFHGDKINEEENNQSTIH